MTNTGKIQAIRSVLLLNDPDKSRYIKLLEDLGDLKTNYGDYMITEPIDCNEELKRVSGADYELCTALLTMLLREVEIRRCSGGMFLVRFTDTGGGIQVKAHRLFATREEAEKSIEKASETKKVRGNPYDRWY